MSSATHTDRAPALHRAIVSVMGPRGGQLAVFFEVPWEVMTHPDESPRDWLALQLAVLWALPDARQLVITEVQRERQLFASARGGAHTGDMRLFELGHWHGPLYAEPARTLMLVPPATLARLCNAQASLPIVDAERAMRQRG